MIIKAIQTVYNGYRFRSRLEARWAVFFDALGVKWEYEKEGLFLLSGKWYLPDFWLPSEDLYWEVKSSEVDISTLYSELGEIADKEEGCNIVIAHGPPWDYHACDFIGHGDEGRWAHCPLCHRVGFVYAGWAGYINGCNCYSIPAKAYKFDGTSTERMLTAIAAAKQARFEHGESGILRRNAAC